MVLAETARSSTRVSTNKSSGDATPCRMTGVTLHSHVRYKENRGPQHVRAYITPVILHGVVSPEQTRAATHNDLTAGHEPPATPGSASVGSTDCSQADMLGLWHTSVDFGAGDRLRVGWLNGFWGAARAEDAQGTPTRSHISPSILVYAEKEPGLAKLVSPNRLRQSSNLCDCFTKS